MMDQAFRLLDIEPPKGHWWEDLRPSARVQLLVELGWDWDEVLAPLVGSVRGTPLEEVLERERRWRTPNSARSAVVLVGQWTEVDDVWRDRYPVGEVVDRLLSRLVIETEG